jgi:hypothetical protein
MAYASAVALTVYDISRAGISSDYTMVAPTATHGNKIPNDGKTFIRILNGSAAPITATVDVTPSVDGLALPDLVVTVAATGSGTGVDDLLIGPFTKTFEQSDGFVWVVCSAVTTVTIGAFRVP